MAHGLGEHRAGVGGAAVERGHVVVAADLALQDGVPGLRVVELLLGRRDRRAGQHDGDGHGAGSERHARAEPGLDAAEAPALPSAPGAAG